MRGTQDQSLLNPTILSILCRYNDIFWSFITAYNSKRIFQLQLRPLNSCTYLVQYNLEKSTKEDFSSSSFIQMLTTRDARIENILMEEYLKLGTV